MKRKLIVVAFLLIFSVTAVIIGCTRPNTKITPPQSSSITKTTNKTFTVDELKNYNGQNGQPAYVAVNGTVYDVTNAKRWKNGKHVQGITAGVDLTNAIGDSPHGTSVLREIPVVGTLK